MSTDRPRFRYSAYWGTWSLVLTHRHRVGNTGRLSSGMTVEIDLSPVNGWNRADAAHLEKRRWPHTSAGICSHGCSIRRPRSSDS